jgi:beta-phosphoglucomutase-like phosphatase (HAD superfamily)
MIRALIFDFDGLILDTETPVYRSWQEFYASYGGRLEYDEWAQVVGTVSKEADHFARLEAQIGYVLDHQALVDELIERLLPDPGHGAGPDAR